MRFASLSFALLLALAGCNAKSGDGADTFGDDCRPTGEASFVFGKVTGPGRSPLTAANVTAKGLGGHQHQASVETDGAGCYSLELPAAQFHDLSASKSGYAAKTEKSVALGSGEKRKINFELQPT